MSQGAGGIHILPKKVKMAFSISFSGVELVSRLSREERGVISVSEVAAVDE